MDTEVTENMTQEQEQNWSTLLGNACDRGTPRPLFKAALLADLKKHLNSTIASAPNSEFQSSLLQDLKQKQQNSLSRPSSRSFSVLRMAIPAAVAATVMLALFLAPEQTDSVRPIQEVFSENIPAPEAASVSAPLSADGPTLADSTNFPRYFQNAAFDATQLPKTMRGIGMQFNSGNGWENMDQTQILTMQPGILLRAASDHGISGAGFDDGSTITMRPGALIEATDKGLSVLKGSMTVNVPADSTGKFYMHFEERDIAIEPGTMLAVSVPNSEKFADSGAPAPEIKVLDGGMAIARSHNGNGIMLANRVYRLDHYVTPDMPSRPLYASETEEIEDLALPSGPFSQSPAAHMVAGSAYLSPKSSQTESLVGYSRHGSRWVADTFSGQTPIRIRYLSDDYFTLANARRDLAAPLALGSDVIIDAGDGQFFEIFR